MVSSPVHALSDPLMDHTYPDTTRGSSSTASTRSSHSASLDTKQDRSRVTSPSTTRRSRSMSAAESANGSPAKGAVNGATSELSMSSSSQNSRHDSDPEIPFKLPRRPAVSQSQQPANGFLPLVDLRSSPRPRLPSLKLRDEAYIPSRLAVKSIARPPKTGSVVSPSVAPPSSPSPPKSDTLEVEKILDMRQRKRKRLFLVKWKGYEGEGSTSWEPRTNLGTDCSALEEFLEERKQHTQERLTSRSILKRTHSDSSMNGVVPATLPTTGKHPAVSEIAGKLKRVLHTLVPRSPSAKYVCLENLGNSDDEPHPEPDSPEPVINSRVRSTGSKKAPHPVKRMVDGKSNPKRAKAPGSSSGSSKATTSKQSKSVTRPKTAAGTSRARNALESRPQTAIKKRPTKSAALSGRSKSVRYEMPPALSFGDVMDSVIESGIEKPVLKPSGPGYRGLNLIRAFGMESTGGRASNSRATPPPEQSVSPEISPLPHRQNLWKTSSDTINSALGSKARPSTANGPPAFRRPLSRNRSALANPIAELFQSTLPAPKMIRPPPPPPPPRRARPVTAASVYNSAANRRRSPSVDDPPFVRLDISAPGAPVPLRKTAAAAQSVSVGVQTGGYDGGVFRSYVPVCESGKSGLDTEALVVGITGFKPIGLRIDAPQDVAFLVSYADRESEFVDYADCMRKIPSHVVTFLWENRIAMSEPSAIVQPQYYV